MQMRLGKTLLPIRVSKMYTPRVPKIGFRALVVAPNSALGSWEDELILEKENDYIFLEGTQEERREQLQEYHKWYLINKEGFLWLPEIQKMRWDIVIVDEAFLRNPRSLVTKFFLKHFRTVPHRYLLTGTPAPNSPLEYACQLIWLDGHAMGSKSYWAFRAKYFERRKQKYVWYPKLGTMTKLRAYIAERCFVLSREDVDMDVPKVYTRRYFELPQELKEVYQKAADYFVIEYEEKLIKSTKYAPVSMSYLHQLCGGFIAQHLVWNEKIEAIIELLEGELKGEQLVIWFNYNHEMYKVYEILRDKKYKVQFLDGKRKPKERRKLCRYFNAKMYQVMCVQSKLAESGTNLSGSDVSLYYSPPYGSLMREQTEDRILETSKKGPLLIIDLLVKDSVDTAILEAIQQKSFEQRNILDRIVKIVAKQQKNKVTSNFSQIRSNRLNRSRDVHGKSR